MQRTKKAVSLLLSFLLVFSCFTCLATVTAFAADGEEETTYVVAGSEAELFGTAWDAANNDNLMVKNGDKFEKTYTATKAYTDVQLKVVKNGAEWIGDSTGNNVTFNITGAGDFTVAIDPETNEITVTGEIVEFVTDFEYDTVFAVGNGEGFWLNGAAWDPSYAANEMTEVEPDVWEIEYKNVPDGFERQIKFAIDGAWTHNFGGVFEESGVESDAVYNGDNVTFDTEDDSQTVKARLDLTNFDFSTKEGAKFTITITSDEEEETTAPPEEEDATFVVAGSEAEIFGTAWDAANEDNLMVKNGGKFEKTYTTAKAYTDVQLKVVKNGAEWIGDSTGNNVTFNITGAGSFTVAIDPETNEITVTGDVVEFVTTFDYDTVFAVGNGEGFWLNGAAWDPAYAANEMTEVSDDVWEIEYPDVPDGFERQVKFAIDGAWTHNFGGVFEESGVESDAVYNGDNITFDTEEDSQTIKLQLDLSEFDFSTKEGAKFTLTIETEEEPPVEDATFVVAGSEAEIFGTAWDAANEDNLMVKNGDKFEKTYTVDKAYTDVQLKVVKNGAEWIGDATGNNVTFNLTGAGSFTVAIDPETNEITVTGDIVEFVTDFEYDTVFAVGNGEGYWLNGAAWDPAYAANEMTEVADNVWEIEYPDVPDGFERQVKFAIDGAWTHNFGGVFEESGVQSDAVYNGDNITFDTEDDSQTIKLQLDLSEFDFASKEGAKFTLTIVSDEPGDFIYGDVDGDGFVKIDDATAVQRSIAEREGFILEEGTDAFRAADVNMDGRITVEDVTLIQEYLAEFIAELPVQA